MSKPRFFIVFSSPLLSYLFGCVCLVLLVGVSVPFALYFSHQTSLKEEVVVNQSLSNPDPDMQYGRASYYFYDKGHVGTLEERQVKALQSYEILLNGSSQYSRKPEVYSNAIDLFIAIKDYKRATQVATIGLQVLKFKEWEQIFRDSTEHQKKVGECCTSRDCTQEATLGDCKKLAGV